jgi:hypothetical protein
VDVSVLDESRNSLSNRHSSFHVILFSSIRCFVVDEFTNPGSRDGLLVSETENV